MAPEHRQIGSCDGPPDRASMQFRRVRAHHYKLPFSEWASVFPEPRLCKAIELSALFGSHCSGRTRRLARGLKAVVNSSSGSRWRRTSASREWNVVALHGPVFSILCMARARAVDVDLRRVPVGRRKR